VPYTLGAVHHVAATPVQVAVSNPAGLLVALSGVPASIGRRATQPPVLFDLGWLIYGDASGFYQPQRLQLERTILYPLPDSIGCFAISLADGVTADVTELLAAPSAPSYFDKSRNPVTVNLNAFYTSGPQWPPGILTGYTTPHGRIAIVEALATSIVRRSAAGVIGQYYAIWRTQHAGGVWADVGVIRSWDNAIDAHQFATWHPHLFLDQDDQLQFFWADTSGNGGTVDYTVTAKITEANR
jgi:hypothetical protein